MAHIVNPDNLDDDDDAVFSALLSQGLIWIEDDEDEIDSPEFEATKPLHVTNVRTLKGHTDSVNRIAIMGDFAISASSDTTLRVWNWRTGAFIRTLSGHTESINSVVVHGEFALSASFDRTLRIWNWKTGALIRTLSGYTQEVGALALHGDVVVSASFGELWVWNWQTGEHLRTLTSEWRKDGWHQNTITFVAVDGDLVLSYSSSPDILLVRNWQTGEHVHCLHLDEELFSIEGSIAVNGGIVAIIDENYDETYLWDWKAGKAIRLQPHRDAAGKAVSECVFVTALGACAVYSTKSNTWQRYQVDTESKTFFNDTVTFADDWSHIIIGGLDGAIRVVRLDSPLTQSAKATGVRHQPPTTKPKNKNTHETGQGVTGFQNLNAKQSAQAYSAAEVIQAAVDFIRGRTEAWVNFSRVSQHLHERFPDLKAKKFGNYSSLPKFIADHPSEFELREDSEKQGLYWIRLAPKH